MKTSVIITLIASSMMLYGVSSLKCYICSKLDPSGPKCDEPVAIQCPSEKNDYCVSAIYPDKRILERTCESHSAEFCVEAYKRGGRCFPCFDNLCNSDSFEMYLLYAEYAEAFSNLRGKLSH